MRARATPLRALEASARALETPSLPALRVAFSEDIAATRSASATLTSSVAARTARSSVALSDGVAEPGAPASDCRASARRILRPVDGRPLQRDVGRRERIVAPGVGLRKSHGSALRRPLTQRCVQGVARGLDIYACLLDLRRRGLFACRLDVDETPEVGVACRGCGRPRRPKLI